jgi:elongation factor G
MTDELQKIRNIGIIAHIDAGKTTLTERILYYTGKIYKMGEVDDGTTVMDYLQEEQQRGITITSAATRCPWKDFTINLIDTPGHVDFIAEVERSLRVLDGAIVVLDASEGVQAQTETVWRQGQKYGLSSLFFVNKMDKVGADFEMTVDSIRDKLLACPVPVQIPIGAQGDLQGIIDLLAMQAIFYKPEKLGASFEELAIPAELQDRATGWRNKLLEAVAEYDERLMEAFIHDQPVEPQQLRAALRKAVLAAKIQPVFCGSALRYIGVQRLLDGVVGFLPSPLDRPTITAHKPGKKDKPLPVPCDRQGALAVLAFKITSDPHGDLYFLRIYRGTLKSGSRVLNPNRDRRENITRIFEMHADSRKILESAAAGDIVAAVGLKQTLTGDTLCDPRHPVLLESITFPDTVMNMSIEPGTAAERIKLTEALTDLRREDPTFGCKVDCETGQTIISGMGELHLEVLRNRLVRDMKVDVRVGRPKVAYKEAINQRVQAEGKFIRQTGGRGQYGHVVLAVEPLFEQDRHFSREIQFVNRVVGGTVPREYIAAVEKGARDALAAGSLAGYPVVGVKITLTDGSHHPVDSSELAFEQAAALAISDAVSRAEPVLLEPIMRLEVAVPEAYYGLVQGNLLAKRAVITGSRVHGNMRVIDAKVPLAEMFGYSSELRSATAGRGTFMMEPLNYEQVPEQISEKILSTPC